MTVKELEKRTGLPRTSIRFYEQEGLITPERRENNYRDYSQEDAVTLEKIQLLRQLSLDLETIRRLSAGEAELGEVLRDQAQVLEADRADLERYAQVCLELSRAQVSYQGLDPAPWLQALRERPLPPSRRVDPSLDAIAAAPYPWRRWLARALDTAAAAVVWTWLRYFVWKLYLLPWPANDLTNGLADGLVDDWGGFLLLLAVEPVLLALWGYTPGKWLLGLRVRREDGGKLSWEQGLERLGRVFTLGMGCMLPLVAWVYLYRSYDQCRNDRVMPWDEGLRYTVRPVSRRRWAALIAGLVLAAALSLLVTDASYRPPHLGGALSPQEYTENYNFLRRRLGSRLEDPALSQLAAGGAWLVSPSVCLGMDWRRVDSPRDGEWSAVDFLGDGGAGITGFTLTWSPKGDPLREELDIAFPLAEQLAPLTAALSPESGGAAFPWRLTVPDLEREWFQAARSLCGAPFLGEGTRTEVQGPGGITLLLETETCEGYWGRGDSFYTLQQRHPGSGRLTFRLTATLP